ncbi:MAG: fumarylacetoacetate hydrolase family protein [Saprospiraceae bacterium]|nr:fumarylacetoacetate hydrolase family protein [Saprospiraceae bacterium]
MKSIMEIELVLKFGKNGKSIQPQFALGYIESYTLGLDFTARDLQQSCKEKGYPWEIAKSFDHSAVIGDWMPSKIKNLWIRHFPQR